MVKRYVTYLIEVADDKDDPEFWREEVGNGNADIVKDERAADDD